MSELIVILEDNWMLEESMREKLELAKPGVVAVCVATSTALRELLAKGTTARIFLLDNQVPAEPRGQVLPQFIQNATLVREMIPDATIWHTGVDSDEETLKFCAENGIPSLDKFNSMEAVFQH